MPNLRAIAGRPLPDQGMPPGMVTVRVARKMPSNPVAGAEITALIEAPGGDMRKRTAKTDAGGRATFEAVTAGHRFHAEVIVDGEKLSSETFEIPERGGIRTMLIAGLGAGGDQAGAGQGAGDGAAAEGDDASAGGAGRRGFTLGLITGTSHLDASLPAGVVEVHAFGEEGQALAGQTIELAKVTGSSGVQVVRQVTGPNGIARFDVGTAGAGGAAGGVGAAVVMQHGELRLGTDGFGMHPINGVAVEIRVPKRTADSKVISIGEGGRIIVQLREDGIGIIENLPLENHSEQIFDPGPGGIEIPLPREFVNAEGAEGEHKIEIRKGAGVAVHGPIPPRRPQALDPSRKSPDEVTFGFVLPTHGSTRDFEQRFPNGYGAFTFVTDQVAGLTVESAQITGRIERELGGKKYWLMQGSAIPPGGTLRFTLHGLPAPDETGRNVSLALALGLVGAAIAFGRRGGSGRSGLAAEREKLVQRRERLFTELVSLEERGGRTAGNRDERDELTRKLEGTYRELAALDERQAV